MFCKDTALQVSMAPHLDFCPSILFMANAEQMTRMQKTVKQSNASYSSMRMVYVVIDYAGYPKMDVCETAGNVPNNDFCL